MAPSAPRLDGKLIANRYLIGDLLGVGGLCFVYRAEDLRRSCDVAIKVLPPEKAQVKEFAARFQREVTTAKRIVHSNVAAIFDWGELPEGGLFLVMELLQGTLLSQVLAKGRLAPRRALSLARQMLSGLGEAHRLGITHRDVKPHNVMLIGLEEQESVKLFDFGIAANERAALKLTAPGTAFGTPEYISPEMAMGQKVDARADLYSVGVVLFEMLTGRLPFVSRDDIGYLRAHIKEEAPPPSVVAPEAGIAPALDGLVLRALHKDPDARFASAEAMILALEAAERQPLGKRRFSFSWAAALVLLAVGLVIVARLLGAR